MANYLILDKEDKPLTVLVWDGDTLLGLPEGGVKIVQYDKAYYPDGTWDNVKMEIADPNKKPDPATTEPAPGKPVNVIT